MYIEEQGIDGKIGLHVLCYHSHDEDWSEIGRKLKITDSLV